MNPQDASEVVPFLTSAALIMYVQKYLKTRESYMKIVQALPMADRWVHRIVAGIGAFIAAVGIHITFAGTFNTGWTVHGTIPNGWELLHATGDFVKIYVLQNFAYDATRKPITMPHDQPSEVVANTPVPEQKEPPHAA